MNFQLSKETKSLLITSKVNPMSKKKSNYYNSQEFYQRCPDLAPKNVYLYMGRVEKFDNIQKYLDKITKETFTEKCSRWYNNIKNWFNKNV